MSAHLITDLSDAYRASDHSVGSLGKQLAALDTKALPVPTTIIIPQEALTAILEESQLVHELRSLYHNKSQHDDLARYHLREHVVDSIENVPLPTWFTEELLDAYHRYLHRGFIKIQHGSIESKMDVSRFEHIQGDANLVESLRAFWAKMVEHELIKHASIQTNNLAPSAIIVQAQTQAEASGIAYTVHPESGMRQHFFIQAIWGCPDPELMEQQADTYTVDNRTNSVIMRSVGTQARYYRRKQDSLETIPIPAELQNKPILNDELCAELSRILLRLKRQNLHHVEVSWELTPTGYEITSYKPYHTEPSKKNQKTYSTQTKILVTGGNPYKTKLDPLHLADGIGVLRSEYTYFSFGMHPLAAIKGKQRE
ncbi:MAG: PEP/pyruvate-binding domain-containing protein, partial [Patescibacteria group bacterium]